MLFADTIYATLVPPMSTTDRTTDINPSTLVIEEPASATPAGTEDDDGAAAHESCSKNEAPTDTNEANSESSGKQAENFDVGPQVLVKQDIISNVPWGYGHLDLLSC